MAKRGFTIIVIKLDFQLKNNILSTLKTIPKGYSTSVINVRYFASHPNILTSKNQYFIYNNTKIKYNNISITCHF